MKTLFVVNDMSGGREKIPLSHKVFTVCPWEYLAFFTTMVYNKGRKFKGSGRMFGYVRPLVGQMLVSENEFYRALYCGLCRAMGRHTGCASRFSLSYDFVFLCAYRAVIEGVPFTVETHRCPVHPVKPRQMVRDNAVLAYASSAAAVLNAAKIEDDIADESGKKRLAARILSPTVQSVRRRAVGVEALDNAVRTHLVTLSALERDRCDSLDTTARVFGELLGDIFAYGLSGTAARISRTVGEAVGRFVYVTDAADDAPDDAKTGAYNPILCLYSGAPQDTAALFEERTVKDRAGKERTGKRLRKDIAESLYTAVLTDLSRLQNALELIDFSRCQKETAGIVKNIAYLGMPAELRRVLAID